MNRLTQKLRDFADERDWNQFHDPKNLSMALVVEAGELVEIFQWLTSGESTVAMSDPKKADAIREELADIYGYLLRLADILGVSLNDALETKIRINQEKYPVDKAKGNATKYTDFENEIESDVPQIAGEPFSDATDVDFTETVSHELGPWERGEPCKMCGIPFCSRCKPTNLPSQVWVTLGSGKAFHKTTECEALQDGLRWVERSGGEPTTPKCVALQVAYGSGKLPCLVCLPGARTS